jgi:hypothetical protein
MNKQKPEPWTIYIWQRDDKVEAATEALGGTYRQGWEIELDNEVKRNEDRHKVWRAKVRAKNMLNNTLNVLRWYGKNVLNSRGDIDTEKLRHLEAEVAYKLAERNITTGRINLTRKKKIPLVEMNDVLPIVKFPKKEITQEQAKIYGFI